MASWRFEVGARIADWTIRRRLATGGNGEVYEVEHPSGTTGALKCLRRSAQSSGVRARFLREIEAMVACQDLPGVLKVLDSSPDQRDSVAWYVMELGRTLDKRLRGMGFTEAVAAVIAFAGTLAAMHERGYSHRDVKPENLFWAAGKWKVGDFGLVAHRQKARLTTTNKKLGPIYYLAPEMLLDPLSADGARADVFSLAKVLWVALAGQRYPMPGHLHRDFELMRLSSWVTGLKAQKLDAVLHAATHPEPKQRPTMRQLERELLAVEHDGPGPGEAGGATSLPSVLRSHLAERSGEAQRLEQQRLQREDSEVVQRVTAWLSARFGEFLGALHKELSTIEGLQVSLGVGQAGDSSDLNAGAPPQEMGRRYFEHAVATGIKRRSGTYIDFAFGCVVSLPTREVARSQGGVHHMPMDTQPAVVSVAYVHGHSHVNVSPFWRSEATFLLHGAEDSTECARLQREMREKFVPFLDFILEQADAT